MPAHMKYQRGKTKYILRKYHEINSPSGVSRRPKQGFTIPIASWLTTALKTWANDILDPVQIDRCQDAAFVGQQGHFPAGIRALDRSHLRRGIILIDPVNENNIS
jgi:asparagine synthetase B (glutamine-hydrolysing)